MQKPSITAPVFPTCPTAHLHSAAQRRHTEWTQTRVRAFQKQVLADLPKAATPLDIYQLDNRR